MVYSAVMTHVTSLVLAALLALPACASRSQSADVEPEPTLEPEVPDLDETPDEGAREPGGLDREPDVVFVPTPQEAVEKMLELAEVKKSDKLYDLGCGDGRIVVTAAKKYGTRGVGVDIDPRRVEESLDNVRKSGVEDLVNIVHGDIFEFDFSDADVVTLYLLPSLNVDLMPKLAKLKPGTRIVSYEFDMRGAEPAEIYEGESSDGFSYRIYKWVVPWEPEE
jgi:SAM-dependent methyltransferase